MNTFVLSALSIVTVTNVILALIIFSRGFKKFSNVIFGLLAITTATWSIAIVGFYSEMYHQMFDWIVVTHIAAIVIPLLFLIFSLYFPSKIARRNYIIYSVFFLTVYFIYLILFSESIIGHTIGYKYTLGNLYPVYAMMVAGLFFGGFYYLLRQYLKTNDIIEKKQITYVLVGSAIASSLAILPDLVLPYLNVFDYTWLGPIFTLIMVVSLFLAMLRYKLFNIKVILTEIISILIVVALLLELLSAQSTTEIVLKSIVLIIVTIFSYILIRGVYKEVSQRERIEKLATDLQKANDRLRELDKQKSEFVSFANHQLRAPLAAMRGYASLLLEGDLGKLPAEAIEGVNRIFESTKTLVSIVDDYLNVSRIELGSMKYIFEEVDLKKLVLDVVAELKPNIEKTKVGFAVKIYPEPNGEGRDYRIHADRDKLKQVVVNLIDNGIKYTPKGQVTVTLDFNASNHKFVFKVADNGIGISPEVLPHLFQKFSRAKNANKVNIKGTGLGLFVAKEMVEAHHGTIRVESAGEGKGSAFIVELDPLQV